MKKENLVSIPTHRGKGRARVNEVEMRCLKALARFEAMNYSEAVRLAIREACKTRGLWPRQEVRDGPVK